MDRQHRPRAIQSHPVQSEQKARERHLCRRQLPLWAATVLFPDAYNCYSYMYKFHAFTRKRVILRKKV